MLPRSAAARGGAQVIGRAALGDLAAVEGIADGDSSADAAHALQPPPESADRCRMASDALSNYLRTLAASGAGHGFAADKLAWDR